jgi:hypothetical protein
MAGLSSRASKATSTLRFDRGLPGSGEWLKVRCESWRYE